MAKPEISIDYVSVESPSAWAAFRCRVINTWQKGMDAGVPTAGVWCRLSSEYLTDFPTLAQLVSDARVAGIARPHTLIRGRGCVSPSGGHTSHANGVQIPRWRPGKGWAVTLYLDGNMVGEDRGKQTEPFVFSADKICDVGYQASSPSGTDYRATG